MNRYELAISYSGANYVRRTLYCLRDNGSVCWSHGFPNEIGLEPQWLKLSEMQELVDAHESFACHGTGS